MYALSVTGYYTEKQLSYYVKINTAFNTCLQERSQLMKNNTFAKPAILNY